MGFLQELFMNLLFLGFVVVIIILFVIKLRKIIARSKFEKDKEDDSF